MLVIPRKYGMELLNNTILFLWHFYVISGKIIVDLVVIGVDYRDDELDVNNELDEATPSPDVAEVDTPSEMTIDTRGVQSRAEASKKDIEKLLKKHKIVFLGIIVCVFFLILISVFAFAYSSGGTDYVYIESSCKNVTINYDPYGDEEGYSTTMAIEDYVRVATYAYVSDFPDDDESLEQVYFATAVALRTEAVSNNCKVSYRDKDLKKIKGSIKENKIITNSIEKSKGVVLVDEDDKFVSLHVADYCWRGDNLSGYVFDKIPKPFIVDTDFAGSKIKSNVLKNCECNKSSGVIEISEDEVGTDECFIYWSEEETSFNDATGEEETEVTWYKEYLHQDFEDAFQVYGAYYNHMVNGFNYEDILGDYVKNKTYFRTIEKTENTGTVSKTLNSGGTRSSACETSSDDANFMSFLFGWEGNEGFCDNEETIYLAKKLDDNARYTIGVGVTEDVVNSNFSKELIDSNGWSSYFRVNSKGEYDLQPGDCVPVTIIDALRDNQMEKEYAAAVHKANEKYNANLTQYQIDALSDYSYNRGSNYVDAAVKAYVDGGYEALWNNIKYNYGSSSANNASKRKAKQCRLKGILALFVTGDYSDQGKFYDHRDLSDYDNYDSEGIVARENNCSVSGVKGDYLFPLPESATVRCTDVYGYRTAPTAGATNNHQGLDLAVEGGTPIYAARSGEVVIAVDGIPGQDSANSAGNWVKIKHDDGSFTAYMHMANGSVKVKKGDHVQQGDQLGSVGSTGASTGYHLHFSVYEANGNSKDPYNYLDLSSVTNKDSCKGNG